MNSRTGKSLEEGLESMGDFKTRLDRMIVEKDKLVDAERLFGLDRTSYPGIESIQKGLADLDIIYNLYREFKEYSDGMSDTLWVDLDIPLLQSGAEELIVKMKRKIPKHLQTTETYSKLSTTIIGFQDGVPLIASLRSDAMKPRHWQALMKETVRSHTHTHTMSRIRVILFYPAPIVFWRLYFCGVLY